MKKKIIIAITFLFLILTVNVSASTEHIYLINDETSPVSDLTALEVEYEIPTESVPIPSTLSAFRNNNKIYFYMLTSKEFFDTNVMQYITINKKEFIVFSTCYTESKANNLIFKVIVHYGDEAVDDLYNVTCYKYKNKKTTEVKYHNVDEKHYIGKDVDNYYYYLENQNKYVVDGKLFSKKFEINSLTDDLKIIFIGFNWTEKFVNFYYFAFNLYDKENFCEVPIDKITEINLKYNLNTVTETYRENPRTNNITNYEKVREEKSKDNVQTIVADKVVNKYNYFGNHKHSAEYNTIEKISDSTAGKTTLSPTDKTELSEFTHVVRGIGSLSGVELKQTKKAVGYGTAMFYECKDKYDEVSNVNIFEITYIKDTKEYTIKTDSISTEDPNKKPGTDDGGGISFKNADMFQLIFDFLKDIQKFMNFLIKNWWIVLLIIVAIVIVVIIMSKLVGFTIKGIFNAIWRFIKFIIKLPFKALSWIFNFLFK